VSWSSLEEDCHIGNLATTYKSDEPSETESSDEEEWSEDSDGSDCEYDV